MQGLYRAAFGNAWPEMIQRVRGSLHWRGAAIQDGGRGTLSEVEVFVDGGRLGTYHLLPGSTPPALGCWRIQACPST